MPGYLRCASKLTYSVFQCRFSAIFPTDSPIWFAVATPPNHLNPTSSRLCRRYRRSSVIIPTYGVEVLFLENQGSAPKKPKCRPNGLILGKSLTISSNRVGYLRSSCILLDYNLVLRKPLGGSRKGVQR